MWACALLIFWCPAVEAMIRRPQLRGSTVTFPPLVKKPSDEDADQGGNASKKPNGSPSPERSPVAGARRATTLPQLALLSIDPDDRNVSAAEQSRNKKRLSHQTSPVLDNPRDLVDELSLVLTGQAEICESLEKLKDFFDPGFRNAMALLLVQKEYLVKKYEGLQTKIINFPLKLRLTRKEWASFLEIGIEERWRREESVKYEETRKDVMVKPIRVFSKRLKADIDDLQRYKETFAKKTWGTLLPQELREKLQQSETKEEVKAKVLLPVGGKLPKNGRLPPLEQKKN